ncbi:MAG: ATP-binding protein [Kaistella sp.]|nr:ATP-binding protein [Kaistella sp.]
MPNIPFSVSARTARLIGRENVANAEGALIELVKNCYDADSNISLILIDKPNDQIIIIDSGSGMTDMVISEQWMTIGTDDKLNNAITKTGRIKSGAKGIGRFALDRLGESCTMITFPIGSVTGYKWDVNWGDFEQKKNGRNVNINEVYAKLNTIGKSNYFEEIKSNISNKELLDKIQEIQKEAKLDEDKIKSGTALIIKGLRDTWDDIYVNRVFQTLELLNPPEGLNKINIWLFSGEYENKYGLVDNEEFRDYDYKLVAKYKKDKINNAEYSVNIEIHRNEFDFNLIDKRLFGYEEMKLFPFDAKTFKDEEFVLKRKFSELIKGFNDERNIFNNIGNFEFTFYFLKNTISGDENREKYLYKEFLGNRSKWIEKFGGIKLYRDDFRVRPYGEIGTQAYDWLMLGERFGQNPAGLARRGSRVRPNQVAGAIKFSRIDNPYLDDQSNREGIPESETFEVFKNLLLGIIKVQEDDRSTVGFNLSKLYDEINETDKVITDSEKIADEKDDENESEDDTKKKNKTLKKGVKAISKKLEEKEDELATSRAMASAGIMIASFSHEFHGIKNNLNARTLKLETFIKEVIDETKLKNTPANRNPFTQIDEFYKQDLKLKQWIEFAIGLTKKDRRKNKKVDLKEYFDSFILGWDILLKEREIDLKFEINTNDNQRFNTKISELDLDSIFNNLLTNSIEAFNRKGFIGNKEINILLDSDDKNINITYKDSGPGIIKEYENINELFKPFETSKKDDLGNDVGTGLGMWIIKSSVDSNKGKILLKRPTTGFEINFTFKNLK